MKFLALCCAFSLPINKILNAIKFTDYCCITEPGSQSLNFDPIHVFNLYQRMAVVYDWKRVFKEEVPLHLSVRFTSLLHASYLLS